MNRRIFINMMLLTILALLLVSSAASLVFYGQFSHMVRSELKERASIFQNSGAEAALKELIEFKPTDMRVTLIHSDGAVRYDNTVDAHTLDNHASREEVAEALRYGIGESRRFSDTLRQETYYYAIRLPDYSILRVSKTTISVLGMFDDALPAVASVVLAMVCIGYFMARKLTARIVAPINAMDFGGELHAPYDELVPFIWTIERLREDIGRQFLDLQDRTNTISAIMNNMSEGILLIDPKGTVLSINKSASALLGLERSVYGSNVLEVIRDVAFIESLRGTLNGNRNELTEEYHGKTYRVFFSPVTGGGAIILFLDITEKAMGEKMRREFSANVSHELKTPLTSIYGHAEMLAGGMVKEEDKSIFYEKIKAEAGRLIALIEDIILISRLDEGKGSENFKDVDVASVAREALEALTLKAQECNVSVHISGDGIMMRANHSMLYEMFYNLLDNAMKYNKPGGSAHVVISQAGERRMITVTDTGKGIPRVAQPRVFERFFRVDQSRSRKDGGTGLGLAIVKHIVMLHGGKVSLSSRENKGTTVTMVFDATQ